MRFVRVQPDKIPPIFRTLFYELRDVCVLFFRLSVWLPHHDSFVYFLRVSYLCGYMQFNRTSTTQRFTVCAHIYDGMWRWSHGTGRPLVFVLYLLEKFSFFLVELVVLLLLSTFGRIMNENIELNKKKHRKREEVVVKSFSRGSSILCLFI